MGITVTPLVPAPVPAHDHDQFKLAAVRRNKSYDLNQKLDVDRF